jgi:hypothetical protein
MKDLLANLNEKLFPIYSSNISNSSPRNNLISGSEKIASRKGAKAQSKTQTFRNGRCGLRIKNALYTNELM